MHYHPYNIGPSATNVSGQRIHGSNLVVSIPAAKGQRWNPATHLKTCSIPTKSSDTMSLSSVSTKPTELEYGFYDTKSLSSMSSKSSVSSKSTTSPGGQSLNVGAPKYVPAKILIKGRGEVPFVHNRASSNKNTAASFTNHRPPQTIQVTESDAKTHPRRCSKKHKRIKTKVSRTSTAEKPDSTVKPDQQPELIVDWSSKSSSDTYSDCVWLPGEFKAWTLSPPCDDSLFDVTSYGTHYWMPPSTPKVLPRIIADMFHQRRRRNGF